MRAAAKPRQEWATREERGAVMTIRLMVWIALSLGRPVARLLLYPICGYFLMFSTASRRASRAYLTRVLERRPDLRDQFRHYHEFACCVLDRVYFLNDRVDLFDLRVTGEELLDDIAKRGTGCILLGAHLGSFEVLRAIGRRRRDLNVAVVMYEENARKINSVLNAINPALTMDLISLGRPTAMIEIGERLAAGGFVGVLADRGLNEEDQQRIAFLGAPAPFPTGPFRMAALMKRPVVLMVGLYRGGKRYDIHFEYLFDGASLAAGAREAALGEAMKAYAARIAHYCRAAPYNWFNFYDFWR